MADKNPPLPADVPWSPAAGILFIVFFFLISLLAAFLGHVFPRHWGIGPHVFFTQGCLLIALSAFLFVKAGSLARLRRLSALHGVRPVVLLKKSGIPVILSGLAIYVWFLLNAYMRSRLGYTIEEQPQVQWLRDYRTVFGKYEFYGVLFTIIIVAPLAEEVLYRMLLYFPLRYRIGPVKATVVVSLLFAVLHVYITESGPEFVMSALLIIGHLFILSILFTVMLERTRSLLAPILAHMVYNGAVVLLVVRGLAST